MSADAHPAAAFLKAKSRLSRTPIAGAAVSAVVNAILIVVQYRLLASVVDGAVFHGQGLDDAWPRLWPMLAVIAIRTLAVWGSEAFAIAAACRVEHAVRMDLADRLLALGPIRLSGRQTGDLTTLLVDAVEALEPYYARYLPAMLTVAAVPLAILAAVLPADWLSALILVLTAPLIPLFMILVGKGAERLNQRQWAKLARMSAHFLEAVQGLTTLKLFDASRREAGAIARISEDYRLATMSVLRVAFLSALALEFFATVSIALVAVLIGFRLLWGEMAFEQGLFVLLVAPEFYLPLRSLGAHYHARMDAIGAAGRIIDVMAEPLAERSLTAEPATAGAARPPGPPAIDFADVHLTYPDGRTALRGVSFHLAPGSLTAVVGPSGAGKSSIASLMLGFVRPTAGAILVSGRPVDCDSDSWRRRLAWVPQRPHLFAGTIADNLRLGDEAADAAALRRAAALIGADRLFASLPEGLATDAGERGGRLSGGQVRLVAMTRAALMDAPVLILDEPTASLDRGSERRIGEAMRHLAAGRTVLVIAHRLETVRAADAILVVDQGRIVEKGRHDDLMAADGLYARLAHAGTFGGDAAPMACAP